MKCRCEWRRPGVQCEDERSSCLPSRQCKARRAFQLLHADRAISNTNRDGTGASVTLARRLRLALLAVAVLLAAGPGLAQTTDSPLVAELKRYLNDGAAIATAPFRFDVRDWAEVVAISGCLLYTS